MRSRSHSRSEFGTQQLNSKALQKPKVLEYYQRIEKKERNKTRLKKNSEQKCALALIFALNFGTRDRNRTDTAAMATGF
jgi:hypothetical protein